MVNFRPSDETPNSARYTALAENGEELGDCSVSYTGFEMRFTQVSCSDDLIAEGLARSAMNYCANRGAYVCYIQKEMLIPAFERLGFSENNLSVEIPDALSSSCCSCSK